VDEDISVGRWLGALHGYARLHFDKVTAPYGIPGPHLHFLMRLYHGDSLSQDDLAKFFAVDKATAARAVAKLEKEGYVVRKPDTRDKRIKRVELTEKAKQVEPALRAALHGWSDTLTEGFTEQERATLVRLLQRMAANAERRVRQY